MSNMDVFCLSCVIARNMFYGCYWCEFPLIGAYREKLPGLEQPGQALLLYHQFWYLSYHWYHWNVLWKRQSILSCHRLIWADFVASIVARRLHTAPLCAQYHKYHQRLVERKYTVVSHRQIRGNQVANPAAIEQLCLEKIYQRMTNSYTLCYKLK